MKISIPNQIDASDFNDGEKMITSLMHMISNRYGYNAWYNINAGDFRKIVFPASATNPALFGPRTEKLRKIFDFAQLDKNNYCLKFSTLVPKNHKAIKNGDLPSVGAAQYELEDFRSIQIWCYLLGQWHGKNELISKSDTLIEYDTSRRSATNLEYKNFLVG
tara:strand:+ start:1029 stop:1514 length:486 start_codon:yes stop_codon:yes gene_type:complete